jgi:carboxymethylenebutenolidase
VQAAEVSYGASGESDLRGYLCRPVESGGAGPGRAGLIVIHGWQGLDDGVRALTRRLSGEGYLALAVDLYRGEVAGDPDRALELMQQALAVPDAIEDNLVSARAYLARGAGVDRVGSIGWSFGGGWSLNLALMLPQEIDATVVYYGRLETDPSRLSALTMPILGLFGEADDSIPVATVHRFESVLRDLGKDAEIHIYPNAGHAFAEPDDELYRPAEAEDAWRHTVDFLNRNLRPGPG